MIFREGLLQARGQIVFILALAISTGVIIYLEALDTEDRIRSRVEEALAAHPGSTAAIPPPVAEQANAALRQAEEAYGANRGAAEARAALLTALSARVQLGLVSPAAVRPRVEEVLAAIEADRTPPPPFLSAALSAAAAAFPTLQDRVGRLPVP